MRLIPVHLEIEEMYQAFLSESGLENTAFFVGGADSFQIDAPGATPFQRAILDEFTRLFEALNNIEGLLNEE